MQMQTMQAMVLPGPDTAEPVPARVPVPQIGPDEMLVRVRAVGVGIHDSYFLPSGLSFPYPIGIEAAGEVERVGAAVTGHRAGERIAFVSTMQPKGGVWAEYAAVRSDSLILPIPERMGFEEAAAVPVAGNTVLRALHALAPMPSQAALFVAGASGAIGTFAVQLARQHGWRVAGSASPPNHEYLTGLGATLAVDYRDHDWPDAVRQWCPGGVDGALAVQPATTAPTMAVVRPGATVVSISGDRVAASGGVSVAGPAYAADVRGELLTLMDDIVAERIRLVLERVYPFQDAPAALEKVRTRHARGKLVLSLG